MSLEAISIALGFAINLAVYLIKSARTEERLAIKIDSVQEDQSAATEERRVLTERLRLHEAISQHGPDRVVTESTYNVMHKAEQELTAQRFREVTNRLDRIDVTLTNLTTDQGVAMRNLIEVTSRSNEFITQELQRRRAERGVVG